MKLPDYDWDALDRIAQETVALNIAELPDDIQELARKVPCLYRHWHPNSPNVDPEAIYMLGEYSGYGDEGGGIDESGVITLYLGAIAWYCEDDGLDYETEVRKTFLHELGHHLGLDEDEVESRGL